MVFSLITKNLRMNQEIILASGRDFGHTDIVEFSELPSASSKEMDLALINQWNEKSKIKGIYR